MSQMAHASSGESVAASAQFLNESGAGDVNTPVGSRESEPPACDLLALTGCLVSASSGRAAEETADQRVDRGGRRTEEREREPGDVDDLLDRVKERGQESAESDHLCVPPKIAGRGPDRVREPALNKEDRPSRRVRQLQGLSAFSGWVQYR
ncbi:hypothetical protein B7486_00695 [cyanobacterium TDX16]|nr:hypothetical protein B7486_00695 [cyanobacterium TDX16]